MVIKIEGSDIKVLGGGTQAYNKDTTDKRRPLIMKSPADRQKALKRANNPDIKEFEKVISELHQDLQKAYDDFEKVLGEKELLEINLKLLEEELAKPIIKEPSAKITKKSVKLEVE